MTAASKALEVVRRWRQDPVSFVRDNFQPETIDEWQLDVLRALPVNHRIAMSACKGPGKSCVEAWCVWWLMACHPDAQGFAISITADNLRDGLWKELSVWYAKSAFLQGAFQINSERIASRARPKTWWCSARSFAQDADQTQQANTLAGLHAKVVFIVCDEVGDYPEGVLAAAEGIFSVAGQKAWLIVGGNPTSATGPLYRICTRDAAHWFVIHITGDPDDPKRSPRIDKTEAQRLIDQWGRDNAYVRVNVLGLYPLQGSDKLVGLDVIMAAQGRDMPALAYRTDARVWGIDPARFGDDEAALARRQGVLCRPIIVWRGLDGPELATEIAKAIMDAEKDGEAPDAIFVDQGGVGCSCLDHLKLLNWDHLVHGIDFGGSPHLERFADKRSEMWWEMSEWLKKKPACLPKDQLLPGQLTAPSLRYKLRGKRAVFCLDTKEEMRKAGVPSPDRADALALTFAAPVAPLSREARERDHFGGSVGRCVT